MILSLIAAVSENNVIGREGKLPWHLPDDLQYFRTVTEGKPVIMGRKTFESIGRVLPGRKNIVITKSRVLPARRSLGEGGSLESRDLFIVHSLQEAIDLAAKEKPDEAFIIGGGEIFKAAIKQAQRIYLTLVHTEIDGDVFFPDVSSIFWREVSRVDHSQDERHAYPFTFLVYEKRTLIA